MYKLHAGIKITISQQSELCQTTNIISPATTECWPDILFIVIHSCTIITKNNSNYVHAQNKKF